jgi:hypothetical protein
MGRHALSKDAVKRKLSRDREQSYQVALEAWDKACKEASLQKAGNPSIAKIAL